MTSNVVVSPGLTPDWLKKKRGIFTAFEEQLEQGMERPGAGVTLDQLQFVVEHRNPFVQQVEQAELAEIVALQQEKWYKFFPKGSLDFSDLVMHSRRLGHDWGILTPKRITNNRLFAACQEKFNCWRYRGNLDEIGPPQSFTALRWFKKVQEADEDLQNFSALMLLEKAVPGVWLQERFWMELLWFDETGDHLDKQNATLVTGSFDPDGRVPLVYWRADRLSVDADAPSGHYPDCGAPVPQDNPCNCLLFPLPFRSEVLDGRAFFCYAAYRLVNTVTLKRRWLTNV